MFTLASQMPSHNTRNSSFFYTSLSNEFSKILNLVLRSKVFQLAKSWNSKQWKCRFVWQKGLKNPFFFSQIYSLLSYTPFFSLFPFLLSFLYFSKKNWTSSVPNTAEDFRRVIFQNDWDSPESGPKLLDKLNKITIPFLDPFLLPSG